MQTFTTRRPHVIALLCLTILCFSLLSLFVWSIARKSSSPNATVATAQTIVARCKASHALSECYQNELAEVVKESTITSAQDVLQKLWEIDEHSKNCHAIAHKIALTQVEKTPDAWKTLLDFVDPMLCAGGFFHGILEGHMHSDSSFFLTGKEVDDLCRNTDAYKEGSCLHIMGHLLLLESSADVEKALAECDRLTIPSDECYTGVFMENMTKQNLAEHGLAKRVKWTKDLAKTYEALCATLVGKAANGCWTQMGHMYAAVEDDDAQKVYQQCQKANNKTVSQNCYFRAIQKIAVTADPQEKAYILCDPFLYEESFYNGCLARVINTLFRTTKTFSQRAHAFCENIKQGQKICFDLVEKSILRLETNSTTAI